MEVREGWFIVSRELLEQALQLPKSTRITQIEMRPGDRDPTVRIADRELLKPVAECGILPQIEVRYTSEEKDCGHREIAVTYTETFTPWPRSSYITQELIDDNCIKGAIT